MGTLDSWFRIWKRGFQEVIFPRVCVGCGEELTADSHQLCPFCLEHRFEDANPENTLCSGNAILPECVIAQSALWKFHKGGDIQHIIHKLKYDRLVQVGVDLGMKLGQRVKQHPLLVEKMTTQAVLLPVPLHPSKYRMRGFNQAYEIARGFQKEWPSIPICKKETVLRIKKTRSQTGFSLQRRLENVKGAFQVKDLSAIIQKVVIVIDDVFTTGSTTYELAQVLSKAGSKGIIILTVAQV